MNEKQFPLYFVTVYDIFFKCIPLNIVLKSPSVTERVSKQLRALEFQTPSENLVRKTDVAIFMKACFLYT